MPVLRTDPGGAEERWFRTVPGDSTARSAISVTGAPPAAGSSASAFRAGGGEFPAGFASAANSGFTQRFPACRVRMVSRSRRASTVFGANRRTLA